MNGRVSADLWRERRRFFADLSCLRGVLVYEAHSTREERMSKVAVLGSGPVGERLADGFLKHGHDVMRGSRDPAKLADWQTKAGAKAQTGTFADAARFGEIVVLAVKGTAAESVLELAGDIKGKVEYG